MIDPPGTWLLTLSILVASRPDFYEKPEKRQFQAPCGCPGRLCIRHPFSRAEIAGLLCRVIVVMVEDRMLHQLSLRNDS